MTKNELIGTLDTFTRGYIECALWSSELDDCNAWDLTKSTLATMKRDCESFQSANAELLASEGTPSLSHGGHDFWLTRNRHGAGFWDGDWPKEIGKKLTEASHAFGEVHLDKWHGITQFPS